VTVQASYPYKKQAKLYLISGFRRDVEICALLGYYAASSGNLYRRFGTMYLCYLQGSRSPRRKEDLDFWTFEDGADTLYRNVGKGLPLDAA
jgi:hypothetical protein